MRHVPCERRREIPPLRELCEGLTALPDARPHHRPEQMAIHPVVRVHPLTRRKSLFVDRLMTARIEGLEAQESEDVLARLFDHAERPEMIYAHKWRPGDVVM